MPQVTFPEVTFHQDAPGGLGGDHRECRVFYMPSPAVTVMMAVLGGSSGFAQ